MLWLVNAFSLNMLRHPPGARLSVQALTDAQARALAPSARSAVGHADTAAMLASLLGTPVAANRESIEVGPGDTLLVAQMRGPRLNEGATALPADARIEWLLVRVEAEEPATEDEPLASGTAASTAEPTEAEPRSVEPVPPAPADAEPIAPASVVAPADTRPREEILGELTKAVAWNEPARAARERAALLARFPHAAQHADAAEKNGRDQAEGVAQLERIALREGPDSEAFLYHANALVRRWHFLRKKVQKIREFAAAKRANAETARSVGRPTSSVRPTRDSRILALEPSARWTVLVDETGENFTAVGESGREGRFVAVVLPERTRLARRPDRFHSSKESDAELDRSLQHLLDSDAGVLGVTLRDLPPTPGERWVDGVLELVDWVLLLLPRSAEGSIRVDVRVEERGVYVAGRDWELAAREILRRHAIRDPASVAGLDLAIATFSKQGEPLLAYADVVAHTWSARSDVTKARLNASELRGRCLLEGSAPALRDLWSGFTRDRSLSPDAWAALLATPAADDPMSIAGALAVRLLERAKEQPGLWQGYLGRAIEHLESKAIDLARLGMQLDWLDAAAPESESLPVVARHAWARARLDAANHLGHVTSEAEAELHALGEALLEERAPMVCEGDLRRAVIATNRFDFAAATAALARWEGVEPRVPGLQMWGRVQSSLGQHRAFEGRHAEARARFDTALAAFARLSDPRVAVGERRHTGTYRAIVLMDDPGVPDADARAALENVIGPLDDAVPRLGVSSADVDKYALHLLLRWAFHRGDSDARARLLADAPRWVFGVGHPWPLICLYRALLAEAAGNPSAARGLLGRGVALAWADAQGPTVRFIGLVLATLLAARGVRDARIPAALDEARATLPAAHDRVARVERELRAPGDVRDFLTATLPFNFR
jgi:hypothetical protein